MSFVRLFTTSRLRPISLFAISTSSRSANQSSAISKCTNLLRHPRPLHTYPRTGIHPIQQLRFSPLRSLRPRYNSNSSRPKPDPTPNLGSPQQSLSFSQRLRALSKEYGWTAVGVYLALSVLDFPFCYLAVQVLGPDRVGKWEKAIIDGFWSIVAVPFPDLGRTKQSAEKISMEREGAVREVEKAGHGETASTFSLTFDSVGTRMLT
jgi:hypothetical protein